MSRAAPITAAAEAMTTRVDTAGSLVQSVRVTGASVPARSRGEDVSKTCVGEADAARVPARREAVRGRTAVPRRARLE